MDRAPGGSRAFSPPESYLIASPQPIIITTRLHAQPSRRKRLNQYIRCERVGKGRHGEVYLCRDTERNQREVAIKVVKRSDPKDKIKLLRKTYQTQDGSSHSTKAGRLSSTENSIRKEIAVMKRCRHPNLAVLLEVIDDPRDDKIYLVMEYLCGGPVEWVAPEQKPLLTLAQTRRIMRDVILGLEFMHSKDILHRDIKPANIMYTYNRQSVKLIDFGVSHILFPPPDKAKRKGSSSYDESDPDSNLFSRSDLLKRIGTPTFLAPEVVWFSDTVDHSSSTSYDAMSFSTSFNSPSDTMVEHSTAMPKVRPPITKAIDIWSLAVTFYCLLFGHTPFSGSSSAENDNVHHHEFMLYHRICTQDWMVDDVMGAERIPTGGRDCKDGRSDGYLVVKLLEGMLQKDPRDRMALFDIKRNPFILRDVYNSKLWLKATDCGDREPRSLWFSSIGKKLAGLLALKRTSQK